MSKMLEIEAHTLKIYLDLAPALADRRSYSLLAEVEVYTRSSRMGGGWRHTCVKVLHQKGDDIYLEHLVALHYLQLPQIS